MTAAINRKGVLDVDTVKGCSYGMAKYPCGGCYGLCYANKIAKARGFDFEKSISRQTTDSIEKDVESVVSGHNMSWFRIGTMGDPSHDWALTMYVCEWLGKIRVPVVVTKHWIEAPTAMLQRMISAGTVFNTSVSSLDDGEEIQYRTEQYHRISSLGGRSFLRVVTADFGNTDEGRYRREVQKWILSNRSIIDTPLRIPLSDKRVCEGTILASRMFDLENKSSISLHDKSVYIGHCALCPDQCGACIDGEKHV
jgi:hypothetical protein